MKSLAVSILALLLAAIHTPAALAQQPEKLHLHLEPATTEVHYTLKDTLHTVKGTFHLKAGDVIFDPVSGEAHGVISVDTGSGASGNDTRDSRMKKEFLDVTAFPVATFEPQHVNGYDAKADNQKISVSGTMTLRGVGHAFSMDFAVSRQAGVTTATSHFMIPYVAWGIKDPSIPFVKVEKVVAMDIDARGSLTPEK